MKRKLQCSSIALMCIVAFVVSSGGICDVTSEVTCREGYAVVDFGTDPDAVRIRAFFDAVANLEAEADILTAEAEEACRDLGLALGVAAADMPAGDVEATCGAVQDKIDEEMEYLAESSLTVTATVEPAQCSASFSATADCYADCEADFDIEATPPTCEGGELWVSCSGGCSGECRVPEATVECAGYCEGQCTGSCEASCTGTCSGNCTGVCDGTCSATDSEGHCTGTCTGTCHGECDAECSGSCSGSCTGSCSAGCVVEVTEGGCEGECHGECDADYEPLRCEGGEFNVEASAECEAACEAEVSYEAECTPPRVSYTVEGDMTEDAERVLALVAALEEFLPQLLDVVVQLEYVLEAVVVLVESTANGLGAAVNLGAKGIACAADALSAAAEANVRIEASVSVSVDVTASAGVSAQ